MDHGGRQMEEGLGRLAKYRHTTAIILKVGILVIRHWRVFIYLHITMYTDICVSHSLSASLFSLTFRNGVCGSSRMLLEELVNGSHMVSQIRQNHEINSTVANTHCSFKLTT